MDNATDDFSIINNTSASAGWFDAKPNISEEHGFQATEIELRGELGDVPALGHLFLRREMFGGLVLDGRNGRVFEVDEAAFDFLRKLQQGVSVIDLLERHLTPLLMEDFMRFLPDLQRHQILPEDILHTVQQLVEATQRRSDT